METVIIEILAIFVFVPVLFGIWIITPKPVSKGVNIHIDDKAGVKIMQGDDGVHLDIIYETYDERPADYALFPDIVNDTPSAAGSANRDFWNDVASLDTLSPKRQEEIAGKLAEMGFIRKEDIPSFLNPDADSSDKADAGTSTTDGKPDAPIGNPGMNESGTVYAEDEINGDNYDPENFNTFN